MYDTIIAIDVEATGPEPADAAIIEVAAAVWENGEITRRFQTMVKPTRPLPPAVSKLTGITPEMLADALPVEAAMESLLAFLPSEAVCIAHRAAYDRELLRHASNGKFMFTVIDTVELARICFPQLASHSLGALREFLALPPAAAHRAMADCETLLCLWQKIVARAKEIPPAVVSQMRRLLAGNPRHPYGDFFRRLEDDARISLAKPPLTFEECFAAEETPARRSDEPRNPPQTLSREAIEDFWRPGGALSRSLPDYEPRAGQVQLALAIAEAFNRGEHLLAEAGTGIGKSLAYLLSAVLWSTSNRTPVVISTNTKNLQTQLFAKDIPLVQKALDIPFKAALIRGRRNYLCLRKFFYLLRNLDKECDVEERMRLLNILPWAAWTSTGDIGENVVAERPGFLPLWAKISTAGEECLGRRCQQQRRCFLRAARAKALAADIIIANHSLVFAELGAKSPTLPPYEHLVFDEAHNLEDAATSHLSVEISLPRLQIPLGRLYRESRRSGVGLLPTILHRWQKDAAVSLEDREAAVKAMASAMDRHAAVLPLAEKFFLALGDLFAAGRSDGETLRLQAERRRSKAWPNIVAAKEALLSAVAGLRRALEDCIDDLGACQENHFEDRLHFMRELETCATWLREFGDDMEFVLDGGNTDYVYWIQRTTPRRGHFEVWAAPLRVGHLLHDQLYSRKRTIVFTSATMTVRGSFAFLKKRLGIDLVEKKRLLEIDVGTPFDYRRQCLVAVPLFLPEPDAKGESAYATALGEFLAEVYRRTRGRGMVLFTSYQMLQRCHAVMAERLHDEAITLLAQSISGSRDSITAIQRREVHAVLLGTHSFWEGVDIQGEALSCLTIARLPFAVHTDPIIAGRCEQVEAEGVSAFIGYSLPMAVIRFRQGFGRLIRHRNDRGVVIVADPRMESKRYGNWFKESLPCPTRIYTDQEELLAAIEGFLAGKCIARSS